jgi:hypothetical protein
MVENVPCFRVHQNCKKALSFKAFLQLNPDFYPRIRPKTPSRIL